ncbi:hypothetical protein ABIB86_000396 [Bradyrhizobium sp. JR1.7]|uniref:hypothetical protein n=1 Tax=unclassified Bradyrhizobium TaxID=2631580 RepID=UPI0033955C2F
MTIGSKSPETILREALVHAQDELKRVNDHYACVRPDVRGVVAEALAAVHTPSTGSDELIPALDLIAVMAGQAWLDMTGHGDVTEMQRRHTVGRMIGIKNLLNDVILPRIKGAQS